MTEPDAPDALDRLRAANPVPEPMAVAPVPVLEEILMTETNPAPTDAGSIDAGPVRPRGRFLLAAAAAVVALAAVVGIIVAGGDDGATTDLAVDTTTTALPAGDELPVDGVPVDPGGSELPVDPGGSEVTSCTESFSLDTLAGREFAFDGTATASDDETITFDVNEWFVTLPGTNPAPSITLAGNGQIGSLLDPTTPLDVGARVLIANDGQFVPTCGFTQLYTPETAAEWRAATTG